MVQNHGLTSEGAATRLVPHCSQRDIAQRFDIVRRFNHDEVGQIPFRDTVTGFAAQ
jgi:hypothetical protein